MVQMFPEIVRGLHHKLFGKLTIIRSAQPIVKTIVNLVMIARPTLKRIRGVLCTTNAGLIHLETIGMETTIVKV